MSVYRRKNHSFNERLAVKADQLKAATVTSDGRGRVIISVLPAYSFATHDDAVRFLRRVTQPALRARNRRGSSAEGKPKASR